MSFTPGAPGPSTPIAAPSAPDCTRGDEENVLSCTPPGGYTVLNLYWDTSTGVTKETGTLIADVTNPYTHTGLTNGVTYYYVWTAEDEITESDESDEVNGTPAASGSNLTITADASNDVDQTGARGNYISHSVGVQDPFAFRTYFRFPLASLQSGDTVTAGSLKFNVNFATGVGSDTVTGGPYAGDGQTTATDDNDNPEFVAGATCYDNCDVSADNYFAANTDLRTTGQKTISLGAQFLTDLDAARSLGVTHFTIALMLDDETLGSDRFSAVDGYTQTIKPQLSLTLGTGAAPTITDAEDEVVNNGETNFVVTFDDASDVQSVELNTLSDGTGTAVAQTITAQDATTVTLTIARGGLSLGTVYLVARTAGGLKSNGWQVALVSVATGTSGAWGLTSMGGSMDAPEVSEIIEVNTAALTGSYRLGVGDIRVPVTKPFALIRNCRPTPLSVGSAWTWRLVDKNTSPGPRMQLYSNGALADGIFIFDVEGN